MSRCPKCFSRDIDFQEAGGQSICVSCGTIVEENTIVSSIEFQETGDRSHVIGQYVSANCSKPFLSSSRLMGRHLDVRDSRDTTLFNARRTLSQLASTLKLPQLYIDRSYRLYQLALQREVPHLLIDFADALQINVYSLGKAFLHFLKVLNLNLPVVDPSLYLHRYASRLDFGEKMNSVVLSALRIITRLKKDWIATGRRPDGVCAAALLIASRAHGFDVSQDNTSQLFNIAKETLRKRLVEFRQTPSAKFSLEQFHANDLELEFDPPSYYNSNSKTSEEEEETSEESIHALDLAKDDVFVAIADEELLDGPESAMKAPISIKKETSVVRSLKDKDKEELYSAISEQLPSIKPQEKVSIPLNSRSERKVVVNLHSRKKPSLSEESDQLGEVSALSDSEANSFLFAENERRKRAAVWETTFGSFMEERKRKKRLKEKTENEVSDKYTQSGKLRKKYSKKVVRTTSEAVIAGQGRVKGSSKKINYDALKDVFAGDGTFAVPTEDPVKIPTSSQSLPKINFKQKVVEQATPQHTLAHGDAHLEDEDDEEVLLYEGEDDYQYADEYY